MLLGKTALENLFSKVFTILNSFIFPHEDRELYSFLIFLIEITMTTLQGPRQKFTFLTN